MTGEASPAGAAYGGGWFVERLAPALESPRRIAPMLMELVRPGSVVDIGCGPGTWLEAFVELGVEDVAGVEGNWLDRSMLRIPSEKLVIHDLERPLRLERSFDLALSLEVAEHLSPQAGPLLVETLAALAPVVAFSAAAPFQGGTQHLNEQWPQYWADLFARHSFVCIDVLRPRIWSDDAIAWYYRQNLFVAVRADVLDEYPSLVSAYEHCEGRLLPLVHPERYLRLARASPVRLKDSVTGALFERYPALRRTARALRRRAS